MVTITAKRSARPEMIWNNNSAGVPVRINEEGMGRWKSALSKSQRPSPIKVLKAHGSINWVRSVEDKSMVLITLGYSSIFPSTAHIRLIGYITRRV